MSESDRIERLERRVGFAERELRRVRRALGLSGPADSEKFRAAQEGERKGTDDERTRG